MPISSFKDYKKMMLERSKSKNFVSCILFINKEDPNQKVGRNIIENIRYFNEISGNLITFFMPGYYEEIFTKEKYDIFEISSFTSFIKDLEKQCSWKYSGETELLFLNMIDGELDFSNVYDYPLDSMVRKGRITDFNEVFKRLISSLKNDNELHLGRWAAGAITKETALFLLNTIGSIFSRTFPSVRNFAGLGALLPKNYTKPNNDQLNKEKQPCKLTC